MFHQKNLLFRTRAFHRCPLTERQVAKTNLKASVYGLSTFGLWLVLISHPGRITSCAAEKVTQCERYEGQVWLTGQQPTFQMYVHYYLRLLQQLVLGYFRDLAELVLHNDNMRAMMSSF